MIVQYQKSQYPIDSQGRCQAWVLKDGMFLDGMILEDGVTFRYDPGFGTGLPLQTIDLSSAEESNVKERWDALIQQEKDIRDWWDQG